MTDWWNKNVEKRIEDFKKWLENDTSLDTQYCREHIINHQYKSILDCGSGFCVNYHAFKLINYDIDYTGVDSCRYLIKSNKDINIIEADLENVIPTNKIYDVVYTRGVLEHLKHYETIVEEMIRLAKYEAIIIFFITPSEREDFIDYWEDEDLYHNHYNKNKLESFIKSHDKVKDFYWNYDYDVGEHHKSILHINMR